MVTSFSHCNAPAPAGRNPGHSNADYADSRRENLCNLRFVSWAINVNGVRRQVHSPGETPPRRVYSTQSILPSARAKPMLRRFLSALIVVFYAAPAYAQLPPDKALQQFKVSDAPE